MGVEVSFVSQFYFLKRIKNPKFDVSLVLSPIALATEEAPWAKWEARNSKQFRKTIKS